MSSKQIVIEDVNGDNVYVASRSDITYRPDGTSVEVSLADIYSKIGSLSTTWDGISGKPDSFPPSTHQHPVSQITGLPTSLPANGGNADTVNGKTVLSNVPANAKFTDTVYTHPGSGTNPHGTTKADVGLSNVPNYRIATEAEATTGTSNAVLMTPYLVTKAVESLKQSVSNGKTQVANAITAKGVSTATNAEFATMASNIGKIASIKKYSNVTIPVTYSSGSISKFTVDVASVIPESTSSHYIILELTATLSHPTGIRSGSSYLFWTDTMFSPYIPGTATNWTGTAFMLLNSTSSRVLWFYTDATQSTTAYLNSGTSITLRANAYVIPK